LEEYHSIADRDKPVGKPCPCEKNGTVKRGVCAPGLSYQGAISPIRKAGSGWNDVLKGVSKASGKNSTINHY
jgi:hypothetical protein